MTDYMLDPPDPNPECPECDRELTDEALRGELACAGCGFLVDLYVEGESEPWTLTGSD